MCQQWRQLNGSKQTQVILRGAARGDGKFQILLVGIEETLMQAAGHPSHAVIDWSSGRGTDFANPLISEQQRNERMEPTTHLASARDED